LSVEACQVRETLVAVELETASPVGGEGAVVSPGGGDGGACEQPAVEAVTEALLERFPAAS
jgi:hypothetical protein